MPLDLVLARLGIQVRGVYDTGYLFKPSRNTGGSEFKNIILFLHQGITPEPEQVDAQPGGNLRRPLRASDRQLAPRDIELLLKGKPGGRAAACLGSFG